MGALSIANVMGNCIGKEVRSKLQEIMRSKPNLVSLCGIADDATEADLSGLSMDADGAIILVSELPDKRALASLNMSANGLEGAEAGKALGDAIAASVLKELDISGGEYGYQKCDVEFVQTFSVGLRDNRALIKLDISSNNIGGEQEEELQRICVASGIELTKPKSNLEWY
jgi:hypothetical protein